MRQILFLSSVGSATFSDSLLAAWQKGGWMVNSCHILNESQYRSPQKTMAVFRRRWQMYGGFVWKCGRCVWACRDALKVTTTNPFFAPWLVNQIAGGRGANVNLVYDLFPDALIQAGVLRENSWLALGCAAITRSSFQNCAASVFIGEHLRRHAEAQYGPVRRGVVIPVGADGRPFRGNEPQALPGGSGKVVLYVGQLGRMHEIETVIRVLSSPIGRRFAWRFHASGAGVTHLRKHSSSLPNVVCEGFLDNDKWRQVMLASPIALVTIARGGEKVVMPSKTYSALVAGQAILAICVRDSDLADLVVEHDCGWVIEPGDVAGLDALLERIAESPEEVLEKRRNAYRAGQELYDMTPIAEKWIKLFSDLETLNRQPIIK